MNQQEINDTANKQGLLSQWRDKETGAVNSVYRWGNTLIFENEEYKFHDEEPEQETVKTTTATLTTTDVIKFGYKSVDGLGQSNLAKIESLNVTGADYHAVLKNGASIFAKGIADFAKKLRAAKI